MADSTPDHTAVPTAASEPSVEEPVISAREPLRTRLAKLTSIALVVVVLDQATKIAIRSWLAPGERWPEGWELIHLTHIRNSGAAFGILQGATDFLIIAALIGVGALMFFLVTLPSHSRWYIVALSAVLGGAIGNLIDRVRLGAVTDFVKPWNYPAFNVADSAIVLGIITVIALTFLDERRQSRESQQAQQAGVGNQPEIDR